MTTLRGLAMSAGVLSVAAGLASGSNTWVMAADQDSGRREVKVRGQAEDQTTTLHVTEKGSEYVLKLRDGKVLSASIDGKAVPPDRIVMDEKSIRLLGEDGKTAFEAARVRGGGLAYGAAGDNYFDHEVWAEKRPMIGVTLSDVSEALAGQLGIDAEQSVVISGLSEGMPAEKSGLKKFDVVVKIDGKVGASSDALGNAVRSRKPGDTIALGVLREGKPLEITVTVGEGSPTAVFEMPADVDGEAKNARELVERLSRDARMQGQWAREMGDRYRGMAQEMGERTRLHLERGSQRTKELLEELQEAWGVVKDSVAKDGADKVSALLKQLHEEMDQAGDFMLRVMPRVEFFEQGRNGEPRALVVPAPPAPPAAPSAPRAPRAEMRWAPEEGARSKALEERIESLEARIDALLKKMEEKGGG